MAYAEETVHWMHVNYKSNGIRREFMTLDNSLNKSVNSDLVSESSTTNALLRIIDHSRFSKLNVMIEFVGRLGMLEILFAANSEFYEESVMRTFREEPELNEYADPIKFGHYLGYFLAYHYHTITPEETLSLSQILSMNPEELSEHLVEFSRRNLPDLPLLLLEY